MTHSLARIVCAVSSVVIILGVVTLSTAMGPGGPWLVALACLAVILAFQSALAEPKDLGLALLFGAFPVGAMVAEGAPTWLIGPLGTALLVAGELNALSWACRGQGPMYNLVRRRLVQIGQLATLGLLAALIPAGAAGASWIPRTVAVVVAAAALVALGYVVFSRDAKALTVP